MKNETKTKYAAATSREKTRYRVLDYLREKIPDGASKRVPYREIAESLHVSGGAVRYAMRCLMLERLIAFENDGIRLLAA